VSELQAPLFHRYVRGNPGWLRGYSKDAPEDPVTVISLSPLVCDNVARLMKPLERRRPMNDEQMRQHEKRVWAEADKYLPWAALPATRLWIEEAESGGRSAIYVAPLPPQMRAPLERKTHMAFLVLPSDVPGRYNFTVGAATAGAQFIERESLVDRDDLSEGVPLSCAVFQLQLAITCAMVAAPGIRVNDERKREKRYQFQRGAKAPEVIYKCVDVDLDANADNPEMTVGEGAARGSGVARHQVRGHPRITPKGWTLVRPYWRGDLRYGLRLRDSNVKRHEEMH